MHGMSLVVCWRSAHTYESDPLFPLVTQDLLSSKKRSAACEDDQVRKRHKLTVRKKTDADIPSQALASSNPASNASLTAQLSPGTDGTAAAAGATTMPATASATVQRTAAAVAMSTAAVATTPAAGAATTPAAAMSAAAASTAAQRTAAEAVPRTATSKPSPQHIDSTLADGLTVQLLPCSVLGAPSDTATVVASNTPANVDALPLQPIKPAADIQCDAQAAVLHTDAATVCSGSRRTESTVATGKCPGHIQTGALHTGSQAKEGLDATTVGHTRILTAAAASKQPEVCRHGLPAHLR